VRLPGQYFPSHSCWRHQAIARGRKGHLLEMRPHWCSGLLDWMWFSLRPGFICSQGEPPDPSPRLSSSNRPNLPLALQIFRPKMDPVGMSLGAASLAFQLFAGCMQGKTAPCSPSQGETVSRGVHSVQTAFGSPGNGKDLPVFAGQVQN